MQCAIVEAYRLEHNVRCLPLCMTTGCFDSVDPGASIVDFCGIGDSSDATSHAEGFRRLSLAILAYAARAAHRQHGTQSYGQALSCGSARSRGPVFGAALATRPRSRRDAPAGPRVADAPLRQH